MPTTVLAKFQPAALRIKEGAHFQFLQMYGKSATLSGHCGSLGCATAIIPSNPDEECLGVSPYRILWRSGDIFAVAATRPTATVLPVVYVPPVFSAEIAIKPAKTASGMHNGTF